MFLFILLAMAYFLGLKIDFYKGAIIGAGVISSNVFILWFIKNKIWIMNNIRAKLKSKWVLVIVIIILYFFFQDLVQSFKIEHISERLKSESTAFKIGFVLHLIFQPLLDLCILYALLFKIKIVEKCENT